MKVLDACCGLEKMYHGLQKGLGDNFITIDIRKGDYSYKSINHPKKIIISPMIIAKMDSLPFKPGCFDIILCDPPHMNCGLTGFMGKTWGSWNHKETVTTMSLANIEFSRCLKPTGMLILKIMGDRKELYLQLLDRFMFFLPIQTIRARGFIHTQQETEGAIWYIGIQKEKKV